MPESFAIPQPDQIADSQTAAADLVDYRHLISDAAESANGDVIFNQSLERAAIIIEYIFRKSRHEVAIITQKLIDKIFGAPESIEAAKSFLTFNNNSRLKIISMEEVASSNPLLRALKASKLDDRVDLRVMTPEMRKRIHYHFTVGDSRYFRFEKEPRPGDVCNAVVQFGEDQIGKKLADNFYHLQSELSPSKP